MGLEQIVRKLGSLCWGTWKCPFCLLEASRKHWVQPSMAASSMPPASEKYKLLPVLHAESKRQYLCPGYLLGGNTVFQHCILWPLPKLCSILQMLMVYAFFARTQGLGCTWDLPQTPTGSAIEWFSCPSRELEKVEENVRILICFLKWKRRR